ncbi:MAG: hypothetical protein MZU91_02215 [Desulfosudis oleivorans]|nr:hypothetical protein [Desulfosudis oleivorans]
MDNIIPNVANGGEEEKVEWEPRKMLGQIRMEIKLILADMKFSVHTNRVAVIDGHTVCASVALDKLRRARSCHSGVARLHGKTVSEESALVAATSHRGQG